MLARMARISIWAKFMPTQCLGAYVKGEKRLLAGLYP